MPLTHAVCAVAAELGTKYPDEALTQPVTGLAYLSWMPLYVPGMQAMQAEAPGADEYVPSAHIVYADTAELETKNPIGARMQEVPPS